MKHGKFTVLDLFSGVGGFSTGLSQAGFTPIGGVDFNLDAVHAFQKNHRVVADWASIAAYGGDVEQLRMQPYKWHGEPDVVVGGPPCQAYSTSGQRDPNDPRLKLYLTYLSFVRKKRPLAFVIENVKNLVTIRGGKDMRAVLGDLYDTGYNITWAIMNAWEHGVPQARRRVIFVASMFPGFAFPNPLPENERKTVRDAIGDLPRATKDGNVVVDGRTITLHRAPNHSSDVVARVRRVPEGSRLQKVQGPDERKIGRHSSYGRLSWDQPALAITGSSGRPSSSPCIHPSEDRALTLREAARLQGFDDSFEFHGSDSAMRTQIGNAVPPPLSEALGKALLAHFEDNKEAVEAALQAKRTQLEKVRELARIAPDH